MFRRILAAGLLVASTAGLASAQTRVTFLMRNGERIVGDLTYKGGGDYTLNGKDIPASDVAVIAFVPNDPTPQEVSRVPNVDNNPNELERHVFVTRDGSMVFGKLYKFSPDGNIITFDQREGGRHDVAASNMARIYINPAAARNVYAPILAALGPQSGGAAGAGPVGTSGGQVRIPGNHQWVPTSFVVRRGETIRFNATGEVMWSPEQADRATPAGAQNGRRSGAPPVGNAPGGALVGRVGNGQPFLIGNQGSVRMPASGELFLGINDDALADNTGDFYVTIGR
jgi:hypothetical protein